MDLKTSEVYCVLAYCDDYLANSYRLRVFGSFNEAESFVKETFFREDEKPDFYQNDDFTYYVKNLESKNYKILSRCLEDECINLDLDIREIYIKKMNNFILLPNNEVAELTISFTDSVENLD